MGHENGHNRIVRLNQYKKRPDLVERKGALKVDRLLSKQPSKYFQNKTDYSLEGIRIEK